MHTVSTTHTLGTFCFAELVSPWPDAARQFYSDLFGWTVEEVPGRLTHIGYSRSKDMSSLDCDRFRAVGSDGFRTSLLNGSTRR